MAHDAATFATSAQQWTSPAARAAAEEAHVAAQAAKYGSSADESRDQYVERTT